MLGFAMFMLIVVVGLLTLMGGARLLSGGSEGSFPADQSDRLDRLESAFTSMEARLDDLQEQQRFLERLLSDRPTTKSLGSGEAPPEEDGDDSILFDAGEAT